MSIIVEAIEVWGFEHAIRGMRNPMNSWEKSDSKQLTFANPVIGKNDLELMQKLYKAGTSHRKYLRQIFVSCDITAPLYWWKEFDTYKVGTVANSCSTMHKIHEKEFELKDFSWEHLLNTGLDLFEHITDNGLFKTTVQPLGLLDLFIIPALNKCRERYLETKDKQDWWQMIQLLPTSYNQKRTVTFSYENVMAILDQRSDHKLDEWRTLCTIFRMNLPYIKDIRGES